MLGPLGLCSDIRLIAIGNVLSGILCFNFHDYFSYHTAAQFSLWTSSVLCLDSKEFWIEFVENICDKYQ